MNRLKCEMGDTGYLLSDTAQGPSDGKRVWFPVIQVPGVAVYDSSTVLCVPLPTAFVSGDETRSNAAEEITPPCGKRLCKLGLYQFYLRLRLRRGGFYFSPVRRDVAAAGEALADVREHLA